MKRIMQITTFLVFVWICYANYHLLGVAFETINDFQNTTGVKMEMQQFCLCLKLEWTSEQQLPQNPWPLIASYWKADNRAIPANFGKDKWGTKYAFAAGKGEIYMISAGPDKRFKTKDDVSFTQKLPGFKKSAIIPTRTSWLFLLRSICQNQLSLPFFWKNGIT